MNAGAKDIFQHGYKIVCQYRILVECIFFLWRAKPYVVRIMDEIQAFCIKDMSKPAFMVSIYGRSCPTNNLTFDYLHYLPL